MTEVSTTEPEAESEADAHSAAARRWSRGVRRGLAAGIAGVLAGAGVAATALMLWQHHRAQAHRASDREFVDAARAGVVALLSIDHSRAKDDVQRVLDLSTGAFRDDFQRRADDFISTAEKSNVVTKGSVKAAALESANADSGVVLVAAASQVTNSGGARDDPRPWRMSVTVTRDDGRFKMSDVEFVP